MHRRRSGAGNSSRSRRRRSSAAAAQASSPSGAGAVVKEAAHVLPRYHVGPAPLPVISKLFGRVGRAKHRRELYVFMRDGMLSRVRKTLTKDDVVPDEQGDTLLHWAAAVSTADIVAYVLDVGCDVNATNKRLQTPLHVAMQHGNLPAALKLLMCGATPLALDQADQTPWQAGMRDPSVRPAARRFFEMELQMASTADDTVVIDRLIQLGTNIECRDIHRNTPLARAAANGCVEAVRLLLKHGADANTRNLQGRTPLLEAVHRDWKEVCVLLLSNGADLSACTHKGQTSLHLAVEAGLNETAALLLRHGAPVNAIDDQGMTPLLTAASKSLYSTFAMLIRLGADYLASNNDDETSVNLAARRGDVKLIAILVTALEVDLKHGDRRGNTPMHNAAANGHIACCRFLLGHGADVNMKNNLGQTPLRLAVESGNELCVRYLLRNGALNDLVDQNGETPLTYAKRRNIRLAVAELSPWPHGYSPHSTLEHSVLRQLQLIQRLISDRRSAQMSRTGLYDQTKRRNWVNSDLKTPLTEMGMLIERTSGLSQYVRSVFDETVFEAARVLLPTDSVDTLSELVQLTPDATDISLNIRPWPVAQRVRGGAGAARRNSRSSARSLRSHRSRVSASSTRVAGVKKPRETHTDSMAQDGRPVPRLTRTPAHSFHVRVSRVRDAGAASAAARPPSGPDSLLSKFPNMSNLSRFFTPRRESESEIGEGEILRRGDDAGPEDTPMQPGPGPASSAAAAATSEAATAVPSVPPVWRGRQQRNSAAVARHAAPTPRPHAGTRTGAAASGAMDEVRKAMLIAMDEQPSQDDPFRRAPRTRGAQSPSPGKWQEAGI